MKKEERDAEYKEAYGVAQWYNILFGAVLGYRGNIMKNLVTISRSETDISA